MPPNRSASTDTGCAPRESRDRRPARPRIL